MKKLLLLLSGPLLIAGLMLLSSFGGDENSDYPGGSPAGYTGSPYDGKDCQNCHGGSTAYVEGWITSDIPPEGYAAGTSYLITVTVTGGGEKGFEVSPHDLNGNLLGTLTAGSGNKLVGSGKYVTQSSGSTANPKVWTFTWTAPAAGTGEVTFWGAFCVGKSTTRTSKLVVQENVLVPLTAHASADPQQICTGDSAHLDVVVDGGSGGYSYAWTSNPPGFTSDQKDPWVFPLETTKYFIEVSDGSQTVSDSVEVVVFCLGREEKTPDISLSIFPNPAAHILYIDLSHPEEATMEMTVFSLSGQPVITGELHVGPTASSTQVDISTLPAGTYFVQVRDEKKQFSRRMVKSN